LTFYNFNSRIFHPCRIMPIACRYFHSRIFHPCRTVPTAKFGERAFSYAGSAAWNRLPVTIRNAQTQEHFKKLLKTFLFAEFFSCCWTMLCLLSCICCKWTLNLIDDDDDDDDDDISTPAFSTPAESCRCFHSCILHLCILDRADFSTPAFSVAPTGTGAHDQSPGHRPHSQLQALRAFAAYDLTDLEMTPWRRPCYFRQLISSNGPLV